MPNSRCIGTGAREGDIGLIPGPGRRGTGHNRAGPGAPGDRCKYILMKLPEMEASWRLRDVNTY